MDWQSIFSTARAMVNRTLFTIKETPITLTSIFIFVLFIWLIFVLSRASRRVLARWLAKSSGMAPHTQYTLTRITQYLIVLVGGIIAFQFVGIDFSGLAVIFGLLSVGIGFGLQNLASNFISGLILLIEQPIKVGDRVTVGDIEGDVEEINIRSTTVRSLNSISIIVPNANFISETVVNWSHGDPRVKLDLSVGVSYNSDPDAVVRSVREVLAEHPDVIEDPEPEIFLREFGDSSWNIQLWFWIPHASIGRRVRSDVNWAIVTKFRANGVEIPYPQRDLHLRSPLPLPVGAGEGRGAR